MENLLELQAKCRYILFQNTDNHYVVARFERTDEHHSYFIATGYLTHLETDVIYDLKGTYVEHYKYGIQFAIHSCTRVLPNDREALIRFFSSDHFHGIGRQSAALLVDALGTDLISKLREDIGCLDQVPQLNEKKKEAIRQGLKESGSYKETYAFLMANGLSLRQISRLEDYYGDSFLQELEEDPYRPYFEISGFGFRTSEQLAAYYQLDAFDHRRRRAQLMQALQESCFQSGSTYMEKTKLFALLAQKSGMEEGEGQLLLDELIVESRIQEEEGRLYTKEQYDAEFWITKRLKRLSQSVLPSADIDLDQAIQELEQELNIVYDPLQKEAIQGFFQHPFLLLNGGPGTGKTTAVKGMVMLYQRYFPQQRILLAAPTGRAAKRLGELSDHEASTIHALLKWDLETNTFLVNEKDPLEGDVLIVDEFSMVDQLLFANLLRAVPEGMRVLLIGDQNQLPSVANGRVLQDLMQADLFPLYSLKQLYRQREGSGIAALAAAIRAGDPLPFEQDVCFIESNAIQIKSAVLQVVESALAKGYEPKDIQVLAPKYQGAGGIDVLNQALQELINPPGLGKREWKVGHRVFREGDKVLQLKNMREDAVFNGDIGEIVEIAAPMENGNSHAQIIVAFDEQIVEYEQEALYHLTHAYCISIHKSQGNEYPIVVMPIIPEYRYMLNQRLLYTGITRAKKGLVLLGDRALLERSLQKKEQNERQTTLCERLQKFFA